MRVAGGGVFSLKVAAGLSATGAGRRQPDFRSAGGALDQIATGSHEVIYGQPTTSFGGQIIGRVPVRGSPASY